MIVHDIQTQPTYLIESVISAQKVYYNTKKWSLRCEWEGGGGGRGNMTVIILKYAAIYSGQAIVE